MQRSDLIIRSCLIITMTFLTFAAVVAQMTPKEIVTKFFTEYEASGASAALDNLYATNPWMQRNTDAVTNLKSQMEGLNEDFVGKYHGYELIVEKKFSDSYLLLSYLVKFDRQPIRYIFQFYKPEDTWRLHSFEFDGEVDEEIKEASRMYYLDLHRQ